MRILVLSPRIPAGLMSAAAWDAVREASRVVAASDGPTPDNPARPVTQGYALGWFGATWRTVALATAAIVTLTIYVVGIALLGLLD